MVPAEVEAVGVDKAEVEEVGEEGVEEGDVAVVAVPKENGS